MAVIPSDGRIVSPVDAQVVSVADTAHAYGLKTEDGIELPIHAGLETVSLKGECFKVHVKQGDTVKSRRCACRDGSQIPGRKKA